jgi:hypothetical protein
LNWNPWRGAKNAFYRKLAQEESTHFSVFHHEEACILRSTSFGGENEANDFAFRLEIKKFDTKGGKNGRKEGCKESGKKGGKKGCEEGGCL